MIPDNRNKNPEAGGSKVDWDLKYIGLPDSHQPSGRREEEDGSKITGHI